MKTMVNEPIELDVLRQKVAEITKGPVTYVHVSKVYELLALMEDLHKANK